MNQGQKTCKVILCFARTIYLFEAAWTVIDHRSIWLRCPNHHPSPTSLIRLREYVTIDGRDWVAAPVKGEREESSFSPQAYLLRCKQWWLLFSFLHLYLVYIFLFLKSLAELIWQPPSYQVVLLWTVQSIISVIKLLLQHWPIKSSKFDRLFNGLKLHFVEKG